MALDIKTGKRKWHYQMTHHGLWDYDLPCAPMLYDIVVNGRRIKALAQPTKQAFLFVLNRETGEPIWPIEERPVPQATVPNERTSPTQPFPTKPAPFDRQGVSIDDLIDFTPALRAEALEVDQAVQDWAALHAAVVQQRGRPARHDSGAGRYRRRQLAGRRRSIRKRTTSTFIRTRLRSWRHRSGRSGRLGFRLCAGQARAGGAGARRRTSAGDES